MTPAWRSHVDGYRTPRVARGAFEVASTVVVAAAAFCVAASAEFAAVEVVAGAVYAGAHLRLFVLQHDCGHGALFPRALKPPPPMTISPNAVVFRAPRDGRRKTGRAAPCVPCG